MASQQGSIQFSKAGQPADAPEQRVGFQTGLCSWYRSPAHCCAGCCAVCWPCMLSQTGARSGGRYVLGAKTFSESFGRWVMMTVALASFNVVGQTIVQLEIQGEASAGVTAMMNFFTTLVNLFMIYTVYMLRINVREYYGMQRSDCEDLFLSCCCTCCSVVQVAREVGVQEPCSFACEVPGNRVDAYAGSMGDATVRLTDDSQGGDAKYHYDGPAAVPNGYPSTSQQHVPPV